jgi:hypothetical protein
LAGDILRVAESGRLGENERAAGEQHDRSGQGSEWIIPIEENFGLSPKYLKNQGKQIETEIVSDESHICRNITEMISQIPRER